LTPYTRDGVAPPSAGERGSLLLVVFPVNAFVTQSAAPYSFLPPFFSLRLSPPCYEDRLHTCFSISLTLLVYLVLVSSNFLKPPLWLLKLFRFYSPEKKHSHFPLPSRRGGPLIFFPPPRLGSAFPV